MTPTKFNRKTRSLKSYATRNTRILKALSKKNATTRSVASQFGLSASRISQLAKAVR